jgi:hypothetical protein
MRLRVLAIMGILLLAGGCVSAVTLRKPDTGAVAKCGPYAAFLFVGPKSRWDPDWDQAAHERESRCVEQYEKQGYVRGG